jgi:hypothetical protein
VAGPTQIATASYSSVIIRYAICFDIWGANLPKFSAAKKWTILNFFNACGLMRFYVDNTAELSRFELTCACLVGQSVAILLPACPLTEPTPQPHLTRTAKRGSFGKPAPFASARLLHKGNSPPWLTWDVGRSATSRTADRKPRLSLQKFFVRCKPLCQMNASSKLILLRQ